jgi:putative FmdB family regulatory protein
MPIYEYRCRKCATEFELMRPVAQFDAPAPCPACRSRATTRKLSTFSVVRSAERDFAANASDGGADDDSDDWDDDDF